MFTAPPRELSVMLSFLKFMSIFCLRRIPSCPIICRREIIARGSETLTCLNLRWLTNADSMRTRFTDPDNTGQGQSESVIGHMKLFKACETALHGGNGRVTSVSSEPVPGTGITTTRPMPSHRLSSRHGVLTEQAKKERKNFQSGLPLPHSTPGWRMTWDTGNASERIKKSSLSSFFFLNHANPVFSASFTARVRGRGLALTPDTMALGKHVCLAQAAHTASGEEEECANYLARAG